LHTIRITISDGLLTDYQEWNINIIDLTGTFNLYVQFSGSGTTNATGNSVRDAGTLVAVLASANSGYQLDHWVLDTMNVGSANPYVVMMSSNHDLTAVFTEIPSSHLFADGFESGSFGGLDWHDGYDRRLGHGCFKPAAQWKL